MTTATLTRRAAETLRMIHAGRADGALVSASHSASDARQALQAMGATGLSRAVKSDLCNAAKAAATDDDQQQAALEALLAAGLHPQYDHLTADDYRREQLAKQLAKQLRKGELAGAPEPMAEVVAAMRTTDTEAAPERPELDADVEAMHEELQAEVEAGEAQAVAWRPLDAALRDWTPPQDWATCEADAVASRDDDDARQQAVRVLIYRVLEARKAERLTDLPVPDLQALWSAIYQRTTTRSVPSNLARHCRGALANADYVANLAPQAPQAPSARSARKAELEAQLEAMRAAVYALTRPAACSVHADGTTTVSTDALVATASLLPADYTPAT